MATTLTPAITPTTAAIGAVVGGVDLHHALDDATAALLRDALHEHSVLFFHDQDLSEDEQVAVASSNERCRSTPSTTAPMAPVTGVTVTAVATDGAIRQLVSRRMRPCPR